MSNVHRFSCSGKQPRVEARDASAPAYAELAVTTNFSFLRGGSHPEELVEHAIELGLAGLGIADRNRVAGVVRAHTAAQEEDADGDKKSKLKIALGARLVFADGTPDILAYPQDRAAWGRLTRLLTLGKSRAEKGECILFFDDLLEHIEGLNLIVMPPARIDAACARRPARAAEGTASAQLGLAGSRHALSRRRPAPSDAARSRLPSDAFVPLIAVNDVLYHAPERRALQDVVTCIREHVTIEAAGRRLEANAERHLKPPQEMARLFRKAPEAVAETLTFPRELHDSRSKSCATRNIPTRRAKAMPRRRKRWSPCRRRAMRHRYPNGMRAKVRHALDKEFAITAELKYAPYFLTVHDIVRFARSKGILCQGRGSAANSVICYCLGITEVDPDEVDLLFERFVSAERHEPPDIDVDFEHERREEVIQYIYKKYGRERAGLAATVICYRGRSAIREVGKVFGLSEDTICALAGTLWGWSMAGVSEKEARRAGLDPSDPRLQQVMALAQELMGFPRHLSQHVGGFVITRCRLDEVVPIENAAMEDRTVIEWDKDDLDALGLLKVDVLALGMLSACGAASICCASHYGEPPDTSVVLMQDEDQGDLPDDPARRHHRRVPDRKPRADVDAAAAAAGEILRSRHRGRDRAAGTDPGQHGASLSAAA